MLTVILAGIIGLLLGALLSWLFLGSRNIKESERAKGELAAKQASFEANMQSRDNQINDLKSALKELNQERNALQVQVQNETANLARLSTVIEEERKATDEKLALVNDAKTQLADAFKALSSEALRSNNQSFLELAKNELEKFQSGAKSDLESRQNAIKEVITPVKETLNKVDSKLHELEKARIASYAGLNEQVKNLAMTQVELKSETTKLVQALHTPNVRGRWGEIQLKRVVEIAGMLPYCDFDEQVSMTTEDGRLRPDLIARLPGEKNIVVDAKAPLEAYLNSLEAKDEETRLLYLKAHAKQIRDHINKLSAKAYWDQFKHTPEFVVMFLPGEFFFSAALEQDPSLIEEGVNQRVILASPTTLIALLRAVSYGWRQEKLAESAEEISNIGKEMYDRLRVFTEHLQELGKDLDRAIAAYNKAIGSFDSRVLVSARKFTDLGLSSNKEIPIVQKSDLTARQLSAPE